MNQIPFNRASLIGNELAYIRQAMESGVISGEGHFSTKCAEIIRTIIKAESEVLLTSSCTDALEMCAMLLSLKPGDRFITPSFTFVSTANAFVREGAQPVFVDVEPETLNVDPTDFENVAGGDVKAAVVVHYAGVVCDMAKIMGSAARHNTPVVEDAAHALGSYSSAGYAGTFGSLSTFSFHETKNVTCGEGGALIVNDANLVERAYIYRDKGTNRRRFQRGDVAFYTWVDVGSSFLMSDVLAAFLCAQLEKFDVLTTRRREIWKRYSAGLEDLRKAGIATYPSLEKLEGSSAHIFFILLDSEKTRKELLAYLRERGIYATFHYQPLHLSPFVLERFGPQRPLPVTENVAPRLLRLPLFYSLTDDQVDYTIDAVKSFFGH